MYYQTERELQSALVTFDFGINTIKANPMLRQEISVGGCKPDIICVYYINKSNVVINPFKWSYKHVYVIWLLRKWHQLSLEGISSLSFENLDQIKLIISDLIGSCIVIRNESGELILAGFMKEIQAEVIAVEVKLNRWKEALNQAKRYQMFADKVFVAMDIDGIPQKQEIIALFKNFGIGLCAVLPNGLDWLVNPRANQNSVSHQREYIIASAINPSHQMLWTRR